MSKIEIRPVTTRQELQQFRTIRDDELSYWNVVNRIIDQLLVIAHIDQQDAIGHIILVLTAELHEAVEGTQHLHLIGHRYVAIPYEIGGSNDADTEEKRTDELDNKMAS